MIEIRPIVLVTGCFDIIHRGHVELLRFAGQHGIVLVGINSDEAVRELKGPTRPINSYFDRAAVLSAFKVVQCVFEIDETDVASTIRWIEPKFWVKGGSYTLKTLNPLEVAAAKDVGAQIVLAPHIDGFSSTAIIAKG
jgi:rfaE bifunctional protein nucleotidyltransferase chain/domain